MKIPPKLVWQKFRKLWWAVSQIVMSSCASHIYSVFITEMSNLSNSFAKYPFSNITFISHRLITYRAARNFIFETQKVLQKLWAEVLHQLYGAATYRLMCFIKNIKNTAGKSARGGQPLRSAWPLDIRGFVDAFPKLCKFILQATTLLGYLNSCLNPIIYTIFNPGFIELTSKYAPVRVFLLEPVTRTNNFNFLCPFLFLNMMIIPQQFLYCNKRLKIFYIRH